MAKKISGREYAKRKARFLDRDRIRKKFGNGNSIRNNRDSRGFSVGRTSKGVFGALAAIILPVTLIVGGLFAYKLFKQFGVKLGFLNAPDTDALIKYFENGRIKTSEQAEKQKQEIFKAQPPTKSAVFALQLAEQIYNLPTFKHMVIITTDHSPGSLSEADHVAFYNCMTQVNNDADVLQLISAFGERSRYAMGFIPVRTMGLASYVKNLFKPHMVTKLNNYYQGKKIKFTF